MNEKKLYEALDRPSKVESFDKSDMTQVQAAMGRIGDDIDNLKTWVNQSGVPPELKQAVTAFAAAYGKCSQTAWDVEYDLHHE